MQTSSLTEFAKRTFFEMMKDVATSVPGHIIAFDPDTQLAQIQIGVKAVTVNGDQYNISPLIEVPVHFAGGQWSLEYQINPGDDGFILFSQRCIDGWKTTGGSANNPILRFHDKSDAVFLPGIRSLPNVLEDFQNNGIRLRNADGSHYMWLKNDGTIESNNGAGNITMLPDGTVNINGAIITPAGAISSPVSSTAPLMIVDGKELKDHVHLPGAYNIGGTPVTGNSGAQP